MNKDMKWVWFNIYARENQSRQYKFLDNPTDLWYRTLWLKIRRYLDI